jgi:hypothetical protein
LTSSQNANWRHSVKEFLAAGMLLFLVAWILGLVLAAVELGSGVGDAPRWIRDVGGYGFAICLIAEVLFNMADLAIRVITRRPGGGQSSS